MGGLLRINKTRSVPNTLFTITMFWQKNEINSIKWLPFCASGGSSSHWRNIGCSISYRSVHGNQDCECLYSFIAFCNSTKVAKISFRIWVYWNRSLTFFASGGSSSHWRNISCSISSWSIRGNQDCECLYSFIAFCNSTKVAKINFRIRVYGNRSLPFFASGGY